MRAANHDGHPPPCDRPTAAPSQCTALAARPDADHLAVQRHHGREPLPAAYTHVALVSISRIAILQCGQVLHHTRSDEHCLHTPSGHEHNLRSRIRVDNSSQHTCAADSAVW